MPIPYLLSYPRSGNTFVRYCLEYITHRPTRGISSGVHGLGISQFGVGLSHVNPSGPPVIAKRHTIDNKDSIYSKIICLVRNYKEAITRHRQYVNVDVTNVDFEIYIKVLSRFDQWDKDRKLLIYYEDLIKYPIENIKTICQFLDIDMSTLDDFVENFDLVKQNAIKSYCKGHGSPNSYTKGDHALFHIKHLTEIQRQRWDAYFETNHNQLYNTYLTRYKENG